MIPLGLIIFQTEQKSERANKHLSFGKKTIFLQKFHRMETGITALHEEIERLNIIISALVEQNRQLKAEISSLKQIAGSTNTSVYSSAEIADGINTSLYSFNKKDNGITASGYASDKISNGVNVAGYSIAENGTGINEISDAVIKNQEGINKISNSSAEKSEGIKHVNIVFVKQALRSQLPARSYATLDKAAKIIMLLYEDPKQSHKTLMRLTGLSRPGMAKHIMMLKRKGLVVRTAFQTYKLTQASLFIIKNAML